MNLETYLTSKKIDAAAFRDAEPDLWQTWSNEFEHMHTNSFTIQKLNLINPIRRKYPLKSVPERSPSPSPENAIESKASPTTTPPSAKPSIPKPVFKPKPKMS